MTDLSTCDTDELKDRLNQLLTELDNTYKKLGPVLEKIGRHRIELEIIEKELSKRSG